MKRQILFQMTSIILFYFYSNIIPQTVAAKYSGEFMSIGVGARALGMGGAYAAVGNDITSSYWNPSSLTQINYPQLAFMHSEHLGNLANYNYAAIALPFNEDYTFSLSVIRLAIDDIPDTRNALINRETGQVIYDLFDPLAQFDYSRIKYFNSDEYAFYISGAKKINEKISLGINAKIIYKNIANYSATGIGFDVSGLYFIYDNLFLAANLQDITTTLVAWETGRNELITPTLKTGVAYIASIQSFYLLPAVDLDIRFENRRSSAQFNWGPISYDFRAGLELSYNNLVALRIGYSDVKQITFGAGVKLPKLNIDYSFAAFTAKKSESLPDSHRLSFILTLEENKYKRK
jgi:hypothetical protein